ncbi:MAG: PEP-CTERM sorting domain-containing protein [Anaerolineae bacterium]|nr:PEP-CTERM sorting domain-containing protein [Phycisphaerae bacterium]
MQRTHRGASVCALAATIAANSIAIACSDHSSNLCLCSTPTADHTHDASGGVTRGSGLSSLPATLVHVFNFEYSAAPVGPPVDPTINVGDSIHWQWDSGFHSVTSVAGSAESYNSNTLFGPGPTFDHTFAQGGTFTYFCTVHGFDNGDGTAGGMFGTITVVPQTVSSIWNVDVDGSWQTASNWTNNAIPNGPGHAAAFGANITAPRGVNVDAPTSVGSLNFASPSPKSYLIAGSSTLSLTGSGTDIASVNVTDGSHSITARLQPVSNTTFNVAQAGSQLTVSNLQPGGAALTKTGAGMLVVNNIRTSSSLNINSGTVAVSANGTDVGASRVGTLSIAAGPSNPTLDLRNNDLIVQNSSYVAITNLIANARNGGLWDRGGITSSAASAANPKNKTLGTLTGAEYLGLGSNSFDGFTVANGDMLVKYTYYGDVDFNGLVDFDDYSRIDSGFNNNRTGWLNGDVDYNGIVDFDDYSLIDQAFNTQSGTLRRAMSYLDGSDRSDAGMDAPSLQLVMQHLGQFGERYAAGYFNSVPEPTSALALSGLAALAAGGRRRPRRT